MDTFYNPIKTEEFYKDCLAHSVFVRIDMIPDTSWRRFLSDKSIKWMFKNFDQSRQCLFLQKDHITSYDNEKWRGKTSHIEAGFTIRTNNIDYMILIEIDVEHLNHFIENYNLEKL